MKKNRTYTCPETQVSLSKIRCAILAGSTPEDVTIGGGGNGGNITENGGGAQKGEAPRRPLTF